MHGNTAMAPNKEMQRIVLTPEMATELLECNTINRPLSDSHVHRIARQINDGKWKFNGDTIKIAKTGDVLDGQHRLWAIIEAKKPVDTILVQGIEKDAFSTIDTLRKPRSGADVVALAGQLRYRSVISAALSWMMRWQHGVLQDYRNAANKIENSDIEEMFRAHPGMVQAVERVRKVRSLVNHPIIAFLYYLLANRNAELAERLISTLEDPAGVGVMDPFYKLRMFFTTDHHRRKEPLVIIALAIKAINAAHKGEKINVLVWKNQGSRVEEFPTLKVG